MKKSIILLALCLACCGCSKDYGVPTTRNYPIRGFYDGLEISDAFDVTVSDLLERQATPGQKGRGIGLLDFIFEATPLNPSNAPFEASKRSV